MQHHGKLAAASEGNCNSQQISVAQATIKQKQADIDNAKLNLSYTVITAPEDGLVSKVNVQPGQYVQAGQQLFTIVMDKDVWVVANFKETQLDKMKIGQKVIVHVDAFPGHDFEAGLSILFSCYRRQNSPCFHRIMPAEILLK